MRSGHKWRGLAPVVMVVLVAAMVSALAGCGSGGGTAQSGAYTDDLGNKVEITEVPKRIVSISPATTEILFALGLGDKVVGVTEYCNYPAEAKKKTKVGTFTTPNVEVIVAQKPDLVLATGGVQAEVLDKMKSLGLTVFAVNARTFDDTVADITKIGEITGTGKEAEKITSDMEERAAVIAAKVKESGASGAAKPTVFAELGYENSIWTAGSGTIISDLIRRAGGTNIGDADSSEYYEFSLEQLLAANPAVYLVGSGSMAQPGDVGKRPGFEGIAAVKNGKVYVFDEDLVYRTGPRLIDGLESIYEDLNK